MSRLYTSSIKDITLCFSSKQKETVIHISPIAERQCLNKKGEIDDVCYKQLRPTGSIPSQLYGLPKIHKDKTPLRPIISQIGSYTYNLAKFLVPILKPLTTNKYSIKDSFSFVQELLSINSYSATGRSQRPYLFLP